MSRPKPADVLLPRLFVAACVFGVFLWLFGEVVFLPRSFAYRDTAHFYYPLFELIQQEWAAGRVPLWNPYEGAGTPLAAIPTASVFYPGKLIFCLPVSFDVAFKSYVLLHILFAAFSAYRLARALGRCVNAAGFAAVSYAFCGSVMFQHCNVVFLCGAAWLPLAFLAGIRMIQERRSAWGIVFGAILAMMTLAGDPQMGYLAGLLIAFLALLFHRAEGVLRAKPTTWRLIQCRPCLLVIAALTGLLLSSIQVLPSVELSRRTSRAAAMIPRNVYEIPGYFWQTSISGDQPAEQIGSRWYDSIIGNPPSTDAYELEITHFSLAPWRLVEFFLPNIDGEVFHQSQRLIPTQRAEHALWVPTLYMGLLPILLAIWSWRVRKTDVLTRWVSWLVLIGVVGSFGAFGVGWLLRLIVQLVGGLTTNGDLGTPGRFPIGDSVGGLYWLFKNLLPGFSYFRYPSKLMGIAAVGLSLLAAQGWDRVFLQGESFPSRVFAVLIAVSLGALACLLAIGAPWHAPLHTIVISSILWGLLRRQGRADHSKKSVWIPPTLLILTTFELGIANDWTVLTAPSAEWHRAPQVAALIERAEDTDAAQTGQVRQPFRVYRMDFTPESQLSGLRWERDTLSPKHHLQPGITMLTLEGTMLLHDYRLFFRWGLQQGPDGRMEGVQPRRAFDAWGTKYFLLPRQELVDANSPQSTVGLRRAWEKPHDSTGNPPVAPQGPKLDSLPTESLDGLDDLIVLSNPDHFPRAWIVHDVRFIHPISSHDSAQINTILQAINFPHPGAQLDLRKTAVVEDESLAASPEQSMLDFTEPDRSLGDEACRVLQSDPNHVEVDAVLRSPGLVVLAEVYYPGWTLEVASDGGAAVSKPILRTNRMMRGVLLPAGRHRLTFRYQPVTFKLGTAVSGISWMLLSVWAVAVSLARRRERQSSHL